MVRHAHHERYKRPSVQTTVATTSYEVARLFDELRTGPEPGRRAAAFLQIPLWEGELLRGILTLIKKACR
jgi:hypothetical protein